MNERRQDFELLQRFSRHGQQPAFTDVVRRHLDLVYATALRKVEDPGAAQEVAQNVFAALAQKAWRFAPDDSLPAWLHKTALLESKSWLRGELRRRRREQTAAELGTTMKTPDEQPALRALVPLLDDALLSLHEKDRTVLLLRYYEAQSLREVGASFGVGEDAAQKRVAGALDKLARFFQRRGFLTATIATTTAALQQTATSASTATASAVVQAALQVAPPALVGFGALLARLASLTKVQTAAVCIALAAIPITWEWKQAGEVQKRVVALKFKVNAVQAAYEQSVTTVERLRAEAARLEQKNFDALLNQSSEDEARRKLANLKAKTRALLTSDSYRWPDDLPFVRVPKSALSSIKVGGGPNTPERLAAKINQFLDLSAREREIAGQIISNYFDEISSLLETSLYETNQSSSLPIPPGAESKIFVLLPLGEKIRTALDHLCSDLETALGPDRWATVQPEQFEFTHYEQVRLLGYTQHAWDQTQEILVNVFVNAGGEPTASWTAGDGTGTSPMPLRLFLSGSSIPTFIGLPQGPPILIDRVMGWFKKEAAGRLSNPPIK